MQDENVDGLEPAKGLDGGGAGIAGRGADHRGVRALAQQRAVHQPRHHLHGEILEGERRPVKQLQQKRVRRDLVQGRDGRVMEAAIGLFQHGFEIGETGIAFEIRAHDPIGRIRVIEAGERGDLIRLKPRPGFRHIEAAVAGEGSEQRALKGDRGRFTAR